jgi:integrase
MTPDQIDFRREIWTLPDVRFKAKGVMQPLTPKMLELIREALGNRSSGYVFSSTDGDKRVTFGTKIKKHLTAESKCEEISYHDYRRTFSTKLQELDVHPRVISLTEGHFDRGIEAYYQQATVKPLDEQLDAYRKWKALLGLING